jgi:acetyltransferase-like isoleucine patch superfamily enzyme
MREEYEMNAILSATVKYATNHIIAHIPSHAIRQAWYRRVLGWRIGPRVTVLMGQHVQMAGVRSSGMKVSIGKGSVINDDCRLYTTGGLIIGENVSISSGAWLVTGTHDIDDPVFPDRYLPIVIGDYVWVGMRATILAGVTIGEGAVVMAGAIVTRDVSPYTVVGGVPARVIRHRTQQHLAYELRFSHLLE